MEREVLDLVIEQQKVIDEYQRFVCEILTMMKDGRAHSVMAFDEKITPYLNDVGNGVSMLIDAVNGVERHPEQDDSGTFVS